MRKAIFVLLVASLSATQLAAQARLFAVDYVEPQLQEV